MSAHTPGPWKWVSDGVPIDVKAFKSMGYAGNPELIGSNKEPVISAGAGEYMPYLGATHEEAIANANLIESAPELLEVAEEFIMQFDDFKRWPTGRGYSLTPAALAVFERARAAIAKARGES